MSNTAPVKIVALLGVSGSGKSIVSRRLLEDHAFTRLRFGDPIRDMLKAGFGLSDYDIDGQGRTISRGRFGGNTPGTLVQTLSHDWGRGSIHSAIWVNEWRRRAAALSGFVLADDLQRRNEADAVRAMGGIVVRVTRPDYIPMDENTLQRQSEIVEDIELINRGPDRLRALTDQLFEELAGGHPAAA